MKKQALCALLPAMLFATAATAESASPFEGFYVGAGIGDSVTGGHVDGRSTFTAAIPSLGTTARLRTNQRADLYKNSFAGDIFAGYGSSWDCFYLGGEIFVKGSSSHRTRSHSDTSVSLFTTATGVETARSNHLETINARLRSWEYGIDLRPGFLLTECTLAYVKVGAVWNRHQRNHQFNAFNSSLFPSLAAANTFQGNIPGAFRNGHGHNGRSDRASLRLGAGLEQVFCDCWSIRAEYVYTDHRKNNGNSNNEAGRFTVIDPVLGPVNVAFSEHSRTRLRNHYMKVGVAYYW